MEERNMDQNPNDISRNTQQTQDAQAGAQQTTQTSQMPPMAGQMPQKAKFVSKNTNCLSSLQPLPLW